MPALKNVVLPSVLLCLGISYNITRSKTAQNLARMLQIILSTKKEKFLSLVWPVLMHSTNNLRIPNMYLVVCGPIFGVQSGILKFYQFHSP